MALRTRSRCLGACCATLILAFLLIPSASAQIAGANVNMVSGTQWPGGDPFLQRQNEPSIAVSSRNPFHLLAGANDYRSVDLALTTNGETGDAWLGLFKSLDGGATWRSILLPGCPYNTPICTGAPKVRNEGFQAAADPTVRAGTNGMFYYAGLVFNRGFNPASAIIAARVIDLNNKENADPNDILNGDSIQYIDTSIVATGSSSIFLDKPTMAVDVPRPGASVCNLEVNQPGNGEVQQAFLGGNVYVAYTAFTVGPNTDPETFVNTPKSTIYFVRSTNCGATWSAPIEISGNIAVNQGTSIAIDPNKGTIYVVWRQFKYQAEGQGDAIVVASSSDGGKSFTLPRQISTFTPFDEGTTNTSFRTNAYPTIAIDGASRVYVAYSARNTVPSGDARIVITTSVTAQPWTTPVPIDNPPVDPLTNPSGRGHQIMPAITFSGGTLSLLYYDLRLDHTYSFFTPLFNLGMPTGLYSEFPQFAGELALSPAQTGVVFNQYIDDSTITLRRHTFDLRIAEALPGKTPVFAPSVLVSQYAYGCCAANQTDIEQMEFNVPNLPLFRSGTAPFMGDYVDLTAGPSFLPPKQKPGQDGPDNDADDWRFNLSSSTPTIYHAAWTDNRDVQAPADGDWTHYTPPNSPALGTTSIFQPGTSVPACQVGFTGSRNQNIYTAPISGGLIFGAPSNAKTLGTTVFNGTTVPFQRAFVVVAQNTTNVIKSYRLTIANQPPGGNASFLQFSSLTTLDLSIPPQSSASRPVFVTSTNPTASVTINIAEITAPQGTLVPNGLVSSTTLNPDLTNPGITNPTVTNPGITNPGITNFEVTNPGITNPGITNPAITNPGITNPGITNPGITNAAFQNVSVVNPGITNPGITNPGITNASIANPGITNPGITNVNPANTSITDTQWTVTNNGNTAGAYTLNLASSSAVPPKNVLQLIISKLYQTPAATTGQDCNLKVETHNIIVTNIVNPVLLNPANPGITNPGITNPGITNATVSLAPGETANVIIRVVNTDIHNSPTFNPATSVLPVVVSQSVNTQTALSGGGGGGNPPAPPITVPPLIITNTTLPDGVTNVVYTATINTQGGNPTAHTFTVLSGSLPPGLALAATTGGTTGLPTSTGTFTFTVQAQDVAIPPSFPQHTASQSLTIRIVAPLQFCLGTLPTGLQGTSYSQAICISGGTPPISFSLTSGSLPAGLTFNPSAGTISGVPTGSGTSSFTIQATDSSVPPQIVSQPFSINIAPTGIGTPANVTFVSQPQNAVGGQLIAGSPVTVLVTDATGAVISGANVVMGFNGTAPCTSATLGGTLSQTTNATGIASFPDLTIDRGQLGFTLLAVAGNATNVSAPFTVNGFCTTKGPISIARQNHSAVTLADGTVLIAGGGSRLAGVSSPGLPFSSAEVYSPSSGTFVSTGNMNVPRWGQTATLLLDGRVLIAGGVNSPSTAAGTVTNTAEIYDPSTHTFTLTTGTMNSARFLHTATLLADGRVVLAGGGTTVPPACILCFGITITNTAEIFDPATGLFTQTSTPMATARELFTATWLPNGQVLIAGGGSGPGGGTPLSSAELFDPVSNGFQPTSGMTAPRQLHAASLLPSGKVLLAGPTQSAEIYDPGTATFTPTGNLVTPVAAFSMGALADGTVISPGGIGPAQSFASSAEIYSPSAGSFALTGSLVSPEGFYALAPLKDGTFLITGGENTAGTVADAEIYYSTAPLAPLAITTTSLRNATQGKPYTQFLLEQGGVGSLTWTLASGSLPSGVTLSTGGVLIGTPTASGTFTFTVHVVDSSTPLKSTTSGTLSITVVGALTFTSSTLPTAFVGVPYSQGLPFTGGTGPYTVVITSGALPTGFNLSSAGVISGTTSNLGPATFTAQVTDSSVPSQTASQSFTLQVAGTLGFITTTLPNGTVGVPYSQPIATTGGILPVAFTLTAGSLPAGLSLTPPVAGSQTATLAGTPTAAGTFNFTETVTDGSTPAQTASLAFTVTIAPAVLPPANVVFLTQPQNSIAGQVIAGSPINILVTDINNTPLPNVTVNLTRGPSVAPCGGNPTVFTQTTNSAGIASYTNIIVNQGQFGITGIATAGTVSAISNSFNVEGFCSIATPGSTRFAATATALPNGLVLLAGGVNAGVPTSVVATAELFDPVAHTFTPTGSMNSARAYHTATPLNDGTVLITGGTATTINGATFQLGPASSSAEIYSPITGVFTTLTATMNSARALHSATLLPDGTVLLAGGSTGGTSGANLSSAEIYDPAVQTFTASAIGMTAARNALTATLLPNAHVLLAGGYGSTGAANQSAEVYDFVAKTFTATSAMAFAHGQHTATLLPNGQVVLMGGDDATNTPTNNIEVFDPVAGTFTASPAVLSPTARTAHSAVLLTDGRVLVDAGFDSTNNLNSAETFNFVVATSTPTGSMQRPRWYTTNTLLPDGTVLVAGGSFSSGTLTTLPAEIFYPITLPTAITFPFTLLPNASQGQPYTGLLLEQGGIGKLTWSLTATSAPLPTGLALSFNGILSGTPTQFGGFVFTAQVTDSSVPPKTGTFTYALVVLPQFQFFGTQLTTAISGASYSNPLPLVGGTPPYTSTLTAGTLPTGLTLANGTITGTTTALGTYTLAFQATDSSVPPQSTTATLTLGVTTPLAITTTTLPNGAVGASYSAPIATTGGLGTVIFAPTAGTLPPGLSPITQGALSGIPTATGTFTFTLTAVDQSFPPQTASQSYTITISTAVAPIALSPNPLNLLANNTGTMTATLSSPAGASGQVINLASSNSSVASVPSSVTVPPTTTSATFQVTAGSTANTATITASATGLTSGTASVVVTTRPMSLATDGPLLATNRTFNSTVTLVQPAASGGVTVTLASNPPGLVSISPASQTIAAGQTSAIFTLTAGTTAGSVTLTASASGYTNAIAPLAVTANLISFGTIPVVAPAQIASLPVSLSFAAPPGGLTINFTSANTSVATITPSVFVPAGLTIPSANPQVTGVTIGSTQVTATAVGFASDTGAVTVTVVASLSPTSVSVNAGRSVNETIGISAAAPAGGITFSLVSDNPSAATVPATATVPQGQLSVSFAVTGVAQGSANLSVASPGIATVTAPITVNPQAAINLGTPVVGDNTIITTSLNLTAASPANQLLTLTSSDPTHFLLSTSATAVGTASITLQLTAGSFAVPTFYIEGQNFSGTAAITATLTASSPGYSNGTSTMSLYPTGLAYLFSGGVLNTTTFSAPSTVTAYLVVLNPGTLTLYTYGQLLGPQAPGAVPVAVTSSSTSVGTVTGSPASIGVGAYFTQAINFVPATAGITNLNLATPTGYSTPANQPVQIVATVTAPTITLNSPVLGNNTIISGGISLGAAPPSNETLTITSSDPTHFLLSTSATAVGTASITLQLTAGSLTIPAFYIEGQNFSGTTAITATLTASAPGYATGTTTMSLYPTGLAYLFSGGAINTTTFSSPSTLTVYLVVLNPGTLTLYTYGQLLGPQAPGAVPVAVTSSSTSVGTVTGSPASIGVGAYFTQAINFVPATAGITNLNLATPTGYSTPANQPVQIVATVTAPTITLNSPVLGNNTIISGGISLGAAPPSNETLTITSSDPTHFLLSTSATAVGTASITLQLTAGSGGVPAFYIEGQNFSGTTAITATLTASAPGYATGTTTMSLYPTGLAYLFSGGVLNTTTFSAPSTVTAYLVVLNPGTLTLYTYGQLLGPQAPGAVPVAVTSSSPSVGTVTGSPASIGVGNYFTQAINFVPATAGITNLNVATPTGYSTPTNQPVQIVATVTAPAISLNSPIVGNNTIISGGISLGAAPPSNETLTITSSDPTHFLLSASPTAVGTASITLQLTAGSLTIPAFYIEGQNFSGPIAISATLRASAAGYSDGLTTMNLYPTGLAFLFSGGILHTTTTSSPTTLTVYLVVLNPGTLDLYTYGFTLGPQAPGAAVPVAVASSNTSVGTVSASPASIGLGAYFTQAMSFVPATVGTTNLNLATPAGYSTPTNQPVQIVATVQ